MMIKSACRCKSSIQPREAWLFLGAVAVVLLILILPGSAFGATGQAAPDAIKGTGITSARSSGFLNVQDYSASNVETSGSCGKGVRYRFDKSESTLFIYGEGKMTKPIPADLPIRPKHVVIENGVTAITCGYALGQRYFDYDYEYDWVSGMGSYVETIAMANSVKSIGREAFSECRNLKSVRLPNKLKSLGKYAFSNCSKLRNVSLPSKLKTVGAYAFEGSEAAFGNVLVVPKALKKIGEDAFEGRTKSSQVTLFKGKKPSGCENAASPKNYYLSTASRSWKGLQDSKHAWYCLNVKKSTAKGVSGFAGYVTPHPTIWLSNGKEKVTSLDADHLVDYETWCKLNGRRVDYESYCRYDCSFEFLLKKPAKVKMTAYWLTPDNCSHAFIAFYLVNDDGKTVWSDTTTKGAAMGKIVLETLFTKKLPAGSYHLETLYINDHEGQGLARVGACYDVVKTYGKPSLAKAKVSKVKTQTLDGVAATPNPKVKLGGRTLRKGVDYSVSYAKCNKKGKGSLTIRGINGYRGKKKVTFKIKAIPFKGAKVSAIPNVYYTGKAQKPSPTVALRGSVLKKGTDYRVKYKRNKKAGTASIVLTGKGMYTGKKTVKFKILPLLDISRATVTGVVSKVATGKPLEQSPAVKIGKTLLVKGVDYKVSYKNNVRAGKATMTIAGMGRCKGSKAVAFTIVNPISISDAKISGIADKYYDGSSREQDGLKVSVSGKALRAGVDYKVSYKNVDRVGIATVTVTGIGRYNGSKSSNYEIYDKDLACALYLKDGSVTFSSSKGKPCVGDGYDYYSSNDFHNATTLFISPDVEVLDSLVKAGRDYVTFSRFKRVVFLRDRNGKSACRGIPASMFDFSSKLTSVEGFEYTQASSIGERAFYKCAALERISFPSTLRSVESEAFSGCSALTTIGGLRKDVLEASWSAFSGCPAWNS